MKKHVRNLLLITSLSVAGATWALAPDGGEEPPPPPPPPPPSLNECSPGFWKNHPEYWATQYCASSACVEAVMTELTSKGPGSGERRHIAAGNLNSWADEYYGAQICTE